MKIFFSNIIFLLISIQSLLSQTVHVEYQATAEDFVNPERGFYHYNRTLSSPYTQLNLDDLINDRSEHKSSSSTYSFYSSLIYRFFVLRDFKNTPLSQDFLDNVEKDFQIARQAGVKLILRFCYTETAKTSPPYGDAPKEIVMTHISQLKPLFQANSDIISAVQLGFIGIWGEGYYTDYFGDPSRAPFKLTEQNWNDRNEVLQAMLDAVPKSRMIQTRTPQMKQRFVNGLHAPTNSEPLRFDQAFSESEQARIGLHNDCFLASADDYGTFADYGPDNSNSDTVHLKPYVASDSRYTVVGGETCVSNDPNDDCMSEGGSADREMRRFHYSFLNADYNNGAVNNQWKTQGCIEEIKRKLGYRFVLINGDYTPEAKPGEPISISFEIQNQGYAGLYNPRSAEIVLMNRNNEDSYISRLSKVNPLFWLPDSLHTVHATLCLPENIPVGVYDYYLRLPDGDSTIASRPEYAIRLANENVWNGYLGINNLNASLRIFGEGNGEACIDGDPFTKKSVLKAQSASIKAQLAIFPNPANGVLYCQIGDSYQMKDGVIEILNVTGQKMLSKRMNTGIIEFDISTLLAGVYIIRFVNNGSIAQNQFIKL